MSSAAHGALLRDFLNQLPRDLPAAFEFRQQSWLVEDTWSALRDAGVALCVAESADLKTPLVRTAPYGYFRLRREDYVTADLRAWADETAARASPRTCTCISSTRTKRAGRRTRRSLLPPSHSSDRTLERQLVPFRALSSLI